MQHRIVKKRGNGGDIVPGFADFGGLKKQTGTMTEGEKFYLA